MKKILLSFKADVYKKIISGEKIYEHRKVFPDGDIVAYLYVSAPVKSIVGILKLTNKTELNTWKKKYQYDKNILKRIEKYSKQYRYVMEILEFQETTSIPLQKLREDIPGFVVPQMYYYINDSILLNYLEKNLKSIGKTRVNDFSNISDDLICTN